MQHYLSALQNYIYNQVIQVAWQDLQKRLNDVKTFEDLIEAHLTYIKNALSKLEHLNMLFELNSS